MDTSKNKATKSEKKAELTPVQKFVRGSLRKQYEDIVIGKRKEFNYSQIAFSAKKIFLTDVLNEEPFLIGVGKFYKREKKMWLNKNSRYDKNKDLQKLNERYKNVDVLMLAKYLMLKDKFSLQSKNDIKLLEDIIEVSNGKKLYYNIE